MTTTCKLCGKEIKPGTPAMSIVGGQFLVSDPYFFMIDESIAPEKHAHLQCFLDLLRGPYAPANPAAPNRGGGDGES